LIKPYSIVSRSITPQGRYPRGQDLINLRYHFAYNHATGDVEENLPSLMAPLNLTPPHLPCGVQGLLQDKKVVDVWLFWPCVPRTWLTCLCTKHVFLVE